MAWRKGNQTLVTKVRAGILEKHSWQEVLADLKEAEQSYDNPKGIKVVHKWLRKATGKLCYIEPFLDFAPDGDYAPVIFGGLKFVLKVCPLKSVQELE